MSGLVKCNDYCFLLVCAIWFFTQQVFAHPDEELDAARLSLQQWANAITQDDETTVAGLLTPDFVGPYGQTRRDYLAVIAENSEITGFDFQHAIYHSNKGRLNVSPVIYHIKALASGALSVELIKEDGRWRITSLTAADMPKNIAAQAAPEPFITYAVKVSLRDALSGKPVYARVSITDADGHYRPPRGHQGRINIGWREDVGGDVKIAGKTYAYVRPDFVIDLPVGQYRIEAVKGMEYTSSSKVFRVDAAKEMHVALTLERWINMQDKGWYAGDTHTHFLTAASAILEARAEDLGVINVLATKWGALITNAVEVTGTPNPVSTSDNIVFFNEETRHRYLGHTILHPIRELVYPLSWGGPNEGVAGGIDYPPMAYQADKAHAQGGLVTWAHLPFPYGELAVDVALGKVDTVDVFTWGDAFSSIGTGDYRQPGAIEWWYKFLNTGFRLPATAGTDKMLNTQVSGSVRTYARVAAKQFDYQTWIDALKHGRTFVTTGPMLSFSVNEQDIGSELHLQSGDEVSLEAEVRAPFGQYPVEKLELVQNGKVIAVQHNDAGADSIKISMPAQISTSSWFAARAYGPEILPYNGWQAMSAAMGPMAKGTPVMAHTSPVYVNIPGSNIWSMEDAAFLAQKCDEAIAWARETARFHNEAQRDEIIALYKKAKSVYTKTAR